MATLTSSLIVKLIDGVSGPARAAAASLRGIMAVAGGARGGLGHVLRDNAAAAAQFRNNLLAVSGAALVAGYAIKRALGPSVMAAVAFETTLEDIGQKSGLAGIGLSRLGERIREIGKETGRTAQETAATFDTLLGLGLGGKTDAENVSAATAMLPAINKAATAYRAASEDIARAGQAVFANLKVPADQIILAFDAMAASGKDGAFELRDMAQYFPSITALAANLGIKGVKGAADLAAALQVVRQGAGSSEEAATNLINVLQKANTPATQKAFKKVGINFRKEMDKAIAKGKSPIEAMAEITQKALSKKGVKIGDLFEDRQAQLGILALMADMERYRRIRDEALNASGMVEKDYARRVQTSQAAFDRFRASAENLQIAIGNKLMPTVTAFLDTLTSGLNTVDDRVSIFDKIGKALSGFMTGLGFEGITDLKSALGALMDAIMGNMATFEADTDRLAQTFLKFSEMGAACRELAASIDALTRPLLDFLGTDWGQIATWGVTIGSAAIGISLFGKAIRVLAGALYFLSGARAGIAVLTALGILGGGGAAAGAGGGLFAGMAGFAALVGRFAKLTGWLAVAFAAYEGLNALVDSLNQPGARESTAPRPWDEKYSQDHPAFTPPEGGSKGYYDQRMEERNRLRAAAGLPPVGMEADKPAARGGGIGSDHVAGLKREADAAKSSLDAVNATSVAPPIDTRGLAEAVALAERLRSALIDINGTPVRVQTSSGLGQALRGIHSDTGIE